jgi:hypothetical protein
MRTNGGCRCIDLYGTPYRSTPHGETRYLANLLGEAYDQIAKLEAKLALAKNVVEVADNARYCLEHEDSPNMFYPDLCDSLDAYNGAKDD